jgi:AcrR family transcriptional regulator
VTRSSNISRRRKTALSAGGAEYTAKRDELIRLAATLFRQNGYQATRLADIAVAAGIDRASLYYYIGGKEELFRESVEGILDANLAGAQAIAARSQEAVAPRLREIVDLLMASYEAAFPQMYVYIQEQMHQVAKDPSTWAKEILRKTRQFETVVRDLLEEGVQNGEFRSDISARLASNALFGMLNWTHRWFTPGGSLGAQDVSGAFFEIFIGGMRAAGDGGNGRATEKKPKARKRRAS